MTDEQGRVIAGRYRLAGTLGRGGMGVVWRARDEVLDREVAVKEVLSPPGLTEAEQQTMRRRAIREARSAARLSHPGVVTVHDVVEEDGRPWVVMELVHARSLQEIVDQDGPLDAARAAGIGRQVLNALSAAHAVGILHRDVKPGNVLVADDDRVVLTDFGIAVIEGEATLTRTGGFVGSPAYIAPERVRGQKASPAADLWGLGVTLYMAVAGHLPFQREDTVAVLGAVLEDEPAPLPGGGALAQAVEGLLRKDPARRLTATRTLALLDAAADPSTGLATTRQDGLPPRRSKRSSRPARESLARTRAADGTGGGTADGLGALFCFTAAGLLTIVSLCGLLLPEDTSSNMAERLDLAAVMATALLGLTHLPMAVGLYRSTRRRQPLMSALTLIVGIFGAAALVVGMVFIPGHVDVYQRWSSEADYSREGLTVSALVVGTGVWLALTAAILWRRSQGVAVAGLGASALWILVFAAPMTRGDLKTSLVVLTPIVYGVWAIGVGRLLRSSS